MMIVIIITTAPTAILFTKITIFIIVLTAITPIIAIV